jgi:hypothetical protein
VDPVDPDSDPQHCFEGVSTVIGRNNDHVLIVYNIVFAFGGSLIQEKTQPTTCTLHLWPPSFSEYRPIKQKKKITKQTESKSMGAKGQSLYWCGRGIIGLRLHDYTDFLKEHPPLQKRISPLDTKDYFKT